MQNDRPIENPQLQKALDEVKRTMARYGLAGACMLVAENEAAFTYGMHAPWSAMRPDPTAPLGWRLRAIEKEIGRDECKRRVEGAVHTICQLSDFGEQTVGWMEQLKLICRRAGIDFTHTPFGGAPLGRIETK